MDHIVYLDAKAKEIENLVLGNKSMILRGASAKEIPYGLVNEGDILYFINDNGEEEVKAMAIVSSVFNSEKLSNEESFETIIRNQDKLQLPDMLFEKLAGKQYLVLIGLDKIREVKPFQIENRNSTKIGDWIPAGRIEEYVKKYVVSSRL